MSQSNNVNNINNNVVSDNTNKISTPNIRSLGDSIKPEEQTYIEYKIPSL